MLFADKSLSMFPTSRCTAAKKARACAFFQFAKSPSRRCSSMPGPFPKPTVLIARQVCLCHTWQVFSRGTCSDPTFLLLSGLLPLLLALCLEADSHASSAISQWQLLLVVRVHRPCHRRRPHRLIFLLPDYREVVRSYQPSFGTLRVNRAN